ncbi:acetate CoA-transferase subunit beta [Aminivibrio sp.]
MLPELSEEVIRHRIAKRIALDFEDGSVVNLGIGIPTWSRTTSPRGFRGHADGERRGGAGPKPDVDNLCFIGAGGRCLSLLPGSSLVASDTSFGLIRGGHLDATVLGALEVDSEANLANWMIPGKMVPGMGGAMDLVTGARKVYVATTHCDKKGRPKLVKKCTLPLTGKNVVSVVVTEFCLIRKLEGRMVLCELAPEATLEDIRANTTMDFDVSPDLAIMKGIE